MLVCVGVCGGVQGCVCDAWRGSVCAAPNKHWNGSDITSVLTGSSLAFKPLLMSPFHLRPCNLINDWEVWRSWIILTTEFAGGGKNHDYTADYGSQRSSTCGCTNKSPLFLTVTMRWSRLLSKIDTNWKQGDDCLSHVNLTHLKGDQLDKTAAHLGTFYKKCKG